MKLFKQRNIHWLILGTLGFLGACSSTNLYKVQREPGFNLTKINKVMILSLSTDPQRRKSVEDEFVRQWRKRKVNAIAGYTVIPPETPLVKASIAPIAKEQGFDTVVVTQLLGRSKIDPNIRGEQFDVTESTGVTEELSPYFQAVVANPEYAGQYELAVVRTNVYDVTTEQKTWSGTSQILVTGEIPAHIKDYVNTILKNLYLKR